MKIRADRAELSVRNQYYNFSYFNSGETSISSEK